ncbi:MAG: DUF6282 family protein [Synergistaceae bacterium]|jgi:hypothetical protein|nr:DUF6282 family protein [Synergistaceae bacterium]
MNTADTKKAALELLHDAVDTHAHSAPSHFPRLVDDLDLAESVVGAAMRGAVVKFHGGCTATRAYLANKHVGREALFGSITLNGFVGGVNPLAVEAEALLGAKIIWFPTIHAANHIIYYGGAEWRHMKAERSPPFPKRGVAVTDAEGRLLPEVLDVLDVAAKYDICVATGHLSISESVALCGEAARRGVRKIVLTHADFETQRVPLDLQAALSKEGVLIEKTVLTVVLGHISVKEMARSIVEIGPEHCVLATDFGQANNPPIPQGFSEFLYYLLDNGLTPKALEMMIRHNPKKMLGLE